ncbi:hypothetical protein PG996_015843 [Apiospora saccharicola]|uniref:Uncharacterized protein n=1 Tax=Apiospora saccharicola TaxID=335842 RepID=A0ABR1TPY9_9PEZI
MTVRSRYHHIRPTKIVHVGHSYGSFELKTPPLDFHGAVPSEMHAEERCGRCGHEGSFSSPKAALPSSSYSLDAYYAADLDPAAFGDGGSGVTWYLGSSSLRRWPGGTDRDHGVHHEELTVGVAELIDLWLGGRGATGIRGSSNGCSQASARDLTVCAGDCSGADGLKSDRSKCKRCIRIAFRWKWPCSAATGHLMTLSTNATAGYAEMFAYRESHGL